MGYADEPYNTTTHLLWFMGAQVAPDADPRYTWTPTSLGWWEGVLKGGSSGGGSSTAVSASTGVNPTETHYSLYGHTIPLTVFGVGRIGCEIIAGPWIENGLASFIVSAGVPADPSGTRELREIAFDSGVVWEGSLIGAGTPNSAGFSTEPFTVRFYDGNLTQPADSLETDHFGADAVAYRPQILLAFSNLPLANTKFKKIPYVAVVIADTSGDDVNLGEAFERLAYSPWVGYTSDEFETSGVTDGLVGGGLIITQDTEFLSLIQQFGRFYGSWNILQTDKLRIVDRGNNVTPDISLDKTRLMGQVALARAEPDSVPRKLVLSTVDPDADYTIVPSEAAFPRDPVNVSSSVRTESMYLPAIMDASTRMAIVTFAKYQEEQRRKKITGTAMAYGLEIEPGDLIGLSGLGDDFPGGEVFKVVETLHGANYSVEFTAESIIQCEPGAITTPPTPDPGDWTDTFATELLVSNQGGWAGNNLRIVLSASILSTSGTTVRITMKASTLAGCSIDAAYIGHQALAGDPYDFDGGQVAITVSGSPSFTIGAGAFAVSDPITFALDETKNLVLAFHFDTTSDVRSGSVSGISGYYKVAANETATSNVSGMTFDGTFYGKLVSRIEVHS